MFPILFGLSMDYEVFLVARIYEEWHRRRDNREAVAHGTPKELIRAAEERARVEARWRRSAGRDDATIRQEVLARFREVIE